jgi:hypothetical protein
LAKICQQAAAREQQLYIPVIDKTRQFFYFCAVVWDAGAIYYYPPEFVSPDFAQILLRISEMT